MGVEDAGRVRGQPRVGRLERFDGATSADHLPDDLAVNVGQAKVSACVAVGQPGVVESHQVKDGRMKVVDVDPVLDHSDSMIVGRPEDGPGVDPGPGQPGGERPGVVFAPLRVGHVVERDEKQTRNRDETRNRDAARDEEQEEQGRS